MTIAMFETTVPMRCLTLWEPWATAIAVGLKQYETRSWGTRYRGPLAIHAGRTIDQEVLAHAKTIYPDFPDPMPGAILCVVRLNDCRRMTEPPNTDETFWGDFGSGRWGWQLDNIVRLKQPLQVIGHQGLWRLDTATEKELR